MTVAEWLLILVGMVGLAGTVLPLLPGTLLILAGAVVYALWRPGAALGIGDLLVLAVLAVAAQGADFFLGARGARYGGAGKAGMVGAVIGAIVGVIALGPIGILVGPIGGAIAGEALYGRSLPEAFRAGIGAGVGALAASVVRFFLGLAMFAYLLWQVVF